VRGAWRPWAALLRRRHLAGLAAWLLDAGRPLALVSAQFLYMGEPLLGEGARQLGRLLESESETDDFIDELSIDEGPGSRTMQGDA